jgi:protein-S-isoprenylcysteine O-methyltransferase Ste14
MELVAKLAVVASLLGIALLRVYGLARSGALGRRLRAQRELPALVVIRTLFGAAGYAILAGWLFDTDWALATQLPLPDATLVIGLIVVTLGLALMAWSHVALGENYETALGRGEGQRLITNGPYRWVRHPMYLSFLIVHVGIFLLTASWAVGLSGIGLIAAIMVLRTPLEERELVERFGDAYRVYAEHTGRFAPRPRHLSTGDVHRHQF